VSEAIEVELGGETYRMSKITLADLAKFENRIRSERLRIALETLPAGSKDRVEIMREVLNGEIDVWNNFGSIGGISYLLWLSVAHNEPDVTYDAFAEKLRFEDMGVLEAILDRLAVGEAAAQESGESPPAQDARPATE
jgi:hypothetical protein